MLRHLREQGPTISAMMGLLFAGKGSSLPELPGPVLELEVPARPEDLVSAYLEVVSGDHAAWGQTLPPHFFSQWGFPLFTRCLRGLPYDLKKAVNAGFSWESRAPLPAGAPLRLRARLMSVDDDGRRALLHTELISGTAEVPDALRSTLVAHVPLAHKKSADDAPKPAREKPTVPQDAVEIVRRRLDSGLGGQFATVTGDVNPIHWLGPYAKAAGFGGVILHGYATAAIAVEAFADARLNGERQRLGAAEGRFTQPLRLPAEVGVFVGPQADGSTPLYVGKAPGEAAYFVGSVRARG